MMKRKNKDVSGEKNPMFGKHHTKESIEKMRLCKLGKHHSDASKEKMSRQRSGYKNSFYGKHHTFDTKKILSEKKREEKNPRWKGDDVGYRGVHGWISTRKVKPLLCEKCNEKTSYDLANISGEYKRDVNDYQWLCRSCHVKSDGRIDKMNEAKELKRL